MTGYSGGQLGQCGITGITRERESVTRCSSRPCVSSLCRRVGQGSVVTQHVSRRVVSRRVIYGQMTARVYLSMISHVTRNTHTVAASF